MKFLSDIRQLILSIWLGGAVFFIFVAQIAFSILPERELAGSIVGRSLAYINYSGVAIAVVLILTSFLHGRTSRIWLWIERFLLLIVAAGCAAGEFVIGFWMSSIRAQAGQAIDQMALDDPLRMRFDQLHQWSVWTLSAAMIAALIVFFIMANRRFENKKEKTADVYDFSKEFKV